MEEIKGGKNDEKVRKQLFDENKNYTLHKCLKYGTGRREMEKKDRLMD